MKRLLLSAALLLSSCVRTPASRAPSWEQEDPSIKFPSFFERFPVKTNELGEMYALDGVTLRAITVALNDFLPPGSEDPPCWRSPAAHRYRFIRQGEVVFVRIDADPAACRPGHVPLDYGVQYAINTDGRILRRLYDGEPEDLSSPPSMDAGERGPEYQVDPSRLGQDDAPTDPRMIEWYERVTGRKHPTPLPDSSQADGGSPLAPVPPDSGSPPTPPQVDGGTSPTP